MSTQQSYMLIEIVGTAPGASVDQAIRNGLETAAASLHGLDSFQVVEIRGRIEDEGEPAETQVILEVGFRLECGAPPMAAWYDRNSDREGNEAEQDDVESDDTGGNGGGRRGPARMRRGLEANARGGW